MTRENAATPSVVLVVDDQEAIRQMERRILEKAGYQVMDAADGASAIALLQDAAPLDLLIADLEMPDLLGDEMARRIRARRPDLKVLFVTGHTDRLVAAQSTLWQGEAFLEKPFTAAALVEAVSLLLHGTLRS